MDIQQVIEFSLVAAAGLFTGSFVIIYFWKSSWKSSIVGRAMLFQALSWLALLFIGVSAVVDGDSVLWNPNTRIAVLALLAASSGFLLYALVSSLNKASKGDRREL